MSTRSSYRLINPYVTGSVETTVLAKNAFNAGKKIYRKLSEHFSNYLENFYFTIENSNKKELTHFRVTEKRNQENRVNFTLVRLDSHFPEDLEKRLLDLVERIQSGGHNEDDSSETSDEDDFFKYPEQPIAHFVYFYLPYYKLGMKLLKPVDYYRIYLPTFSLTVNPCIELRFDLYYYI
jgi:hypothetical protein